MKKGIGIFLFVSIFPVLACLASANAQSNVAGLNDFDAYVKKTMVEWEVPGLAVALVKDDQVVFMKGYGVREVGKTDKVDENTVFPIGSTSKAFTSTAVALMVQDKKVSWDDKVVDHLRWFQMYDPWVTREMTLRDLLANRSGLSDVSEMLWYATDLSRDEIVRRLRYIKPESSFRSKYAYRNCMFLTAGQTIPAITGKTWDEFLKERILKPLGMTRTSTSVRELYRLDNAARPHLKINGQMTPVPLRNIDNIGPAGSINSSVKDMSKWLRFHIANGMLDGKRIADTAVIEETHKPHTIIITSPDPKGMFPWARRADYCLSWVLMETDGGPMVYHNGEIDGIYAAIGFNPEKKLGAVILTNFEKHKLSDVLLMRAIDILQGRSTQEWHTKVLENYRKQEADTVSELRKMESSRIQNTKPSLPAESYAGDYESEIFGRIRVYKEGSGLVLHMGSNRIYDLSHWHFDTFRATNRDKVAEARSGLSIVSFDMNFQGAVSAMTMNDMLSFARVTEKK